MRLPLHRRRRSGIALVLALGMIAVLALLITAALKESASQRVYLRQRRHNAEAMRLAESGIEEAIHVLAAQPGPGRRERSVGEGRYEVTWQPDGAGRDQYQITATGFALAGDPDSPRRRVVARVSHPGPPAAKSRLRVVSWVID